MTEGHAAREGRWRLLMTAAQDGDADAYATLLHECVPFVTTVCRARLRGQPEVEDAVQDTLLTIHRIRHTYDPARPFTPWLATIAERRALDHGRMRGRRAARVAPLFDAHDLPSPSPDPETHFAVQQRAKALREAVHSLSPAQRTALDLAKLQDLPLTEVSRRSGMSVGALKVATHRAILVLRRRLGEQP